MDSDNEPDVFQLTKIRRDQARQARQAQKELLFDHLVAAVLSIRSDTLLPNDASLLESFCDAYMAAFNFCHVNESALSESERHALAIEAHQDLLQQTFTTHPERKILAIKAYLHEQIMGWCAAPSDAVDIYLRMPSQLSLFNNTADERRASRPRSKVFVSIEDAEAQGFKLPSIVG